MPPIWSYLKTIFRSHYSFLGWDRATLLYYSFHCYYYLCCCSYHLLHVLDRFSTPHGSSTTPPLQRWVGAKGQTRGKAPTKGGANISGEHTLPFTDYQMRRGMNSLKDLEHVHPD